MGYPASEFPSEKCRKSRKKLNPCVERENYSTILPNAYEFGRSVCISKLHLSDKFHLSSLNLVFHPQCTSPVWNTRYIYIYIHTQTHPSSFRMQESMTSRCSHTCILINLIYACILYIYNIVGPRRAIAHTRNFSYRVLRVHELSSAETGLLLGGNSL